MGFTVSDDFVAEQNQPHVETLEEDYAHLGRQLGWQGIDIERLTERAMAFAMARRRAGGAIDPVGTYRASGYRQRKAEERPPREGGGSGIV